MSTPDVYRPVFNTLRMLIGLYPDAPWSADSLSLDRDITIGIVKANPQIKWNFSLLSHYIPIRDIMETHDVYPWDQDAIHKRQMAELPHEPLTFDSAGSYNCIFDLCRRSPLHVLLKHVDKLNWYGVSFNPNLTFDFVAQNVDKSWRFIEIVNHSPTVISRRTDTTGVHFTIHSTPSFTVSFWVDYTISNIDHPSPVVHKIANKIINTDSTDYGRWEMLTNTANWRDIEQNPTLPWDLHTVALNAPTLAAVQNLGLVFNQSLLHSRVVGSRTQLCNELPLSKLSRNPRLDWRVVTRDADMRDADTRDEAVFIFMSTRHRQHLFPRIKANELLAAYTRRQRRAWVMTATADLLIPDLAAICAEYVASFDPTQLPALKPDLFFKQSITKSEVVTNNLTTNVLL